MEDGMKKKKLRIGILGSGIGGLAAAAVLAQDGYHVEVFEKNEQVGGRASLLQENGYTFDMGPSWFLMPEVFETYLSQFDVKLSDVLKLIPLNPQYRVFFSDKQFYDLNSDVNTMKQLFDRLESGAGKRFEEYLSDSEQKYRFALDTILYQNANSFIDLAQTTRGPSAPSLSYFLPIERHINHYFHNEKIKQILLYNLVFLGCSSHNAPSMFSMMAYADFVKGVFYPIGGMYEIVRVLVNLCNKYHVTFHLNTPIKTIVTKEKLVAGVLTQEKFHPCDLLISNADYTHTEQIIDNSAMKTYGDSYWKKKTFTPSAFILYLGVTKKLPKLKHHNLYFGTDWRNHFRDIFSTPAWPKFPTLYINKASETDASIAPKGHENLMVLVPIGVGLPENDQSKQEYAGYLVDYVEHTLDIKIKQYIDYQKIFSISDFRDR